MKNDTSDKEHKTNGDPCWCAPKVISFSNDYMIASEALYGFVGWLTSRKTPIALSSKHDASEAARLVNEFIQKHNLAEPREKHYPKNVLSMGK